MKSPQSHDKEDEGDNIVSRKGYWNLRSKRRNHNNTDNEHDGDRPLHLQQQSWQHETRSNSDQQEGSEVYVQSKRKHVKGIIVEQPARPQSQQHQLESEDPRQLGIKSGRGSDQTLVLDDRVGAFCVGRGGETRARGRNEASVDNAIDNSSNHFTADSIEQQFSPQPSPAASVPDEYFVRISQAHVVPEITDELRPTSSTPLPTLFDDIPFGSDGHESHVENDEKANNAVAYSQRIVARSEGLTSCPGYDPQEAGIFKVEATRDTLLVQLKHSRSSRMMLGCIIFIIIVLAISMGVALAGRRQVNVTRPTNTKPAQLSSIYQQAGSSLDGTIPGEDLGISVALCSSSGMRMVTASPTGKVQVWDWDETKQDWGESSGSLLELINATAYDGTTTATTESSRMLIRSPVNVAMSGDCQVVAIGRPYDISLGANQTGRVDVFRNTQSSLTSSPSNSSSSLWKLVGQSLSGSEQDLFGASVALSGDGSILVVGAPGGTNQSMGVVHIMEFDAGQWIHLGAPLSGMQSGQHAGTSVAISNSGDVVAYAMQTQQDTDSDPVRVFVLNTGNWTARSDGIAPVRLPFETAWFVDLSADGSTMVMSNYYVSENRFDSAIGGAGQSNNALLVQAYHYNNTNASSWSALGRNLHANVTGPKSGYVVSVSDSGTRLAMGDPGTRSAQGVLAGHIHLYQYFQDDNNTTSSSSSGGHWCQVGSNHNGEDGGDEFGFSVSMSGDGTRVAVGAPYSRFEGFEHGRVQVFDIVIPDTSFPDELLCEN